MTPLISAKTGIYSIDSLFAFTNGNMSSLSSDDDRLFAVCALFFAPVLLSSLVRTGDEEEKTVSSLPEEGGLDDKTKVDSSSQLSSFVILFLRQVFLPLLKAFDPRDDEFCQSLLLTMIRLQTLCAKPSNYDVSCIRHDVTRIIGYIFGGCASLSDDASFSKRLSRPQHDVHAVLREVAYAVAEKIEQSHKNPIVRRLRWLCLADVIVDCPSQELRQQFSKASANIEEVQTGDNVHAAESGVRSLLFWLLATPLLSDPDRVVLEYTSRRIHEVIFAENYSLLLSLFSSNEDFLCFSIHVSSTPRLKAATQPTYELLYASDRVASEFFRDVDRLLHDSCGFSESQLSFTMAKSGHDKAS